MKELIKSLERKKERFRALDKLVPDGRTDTLCDTLSSAKNKCYIITLAASFVTPISWKGKISKSL